MFPLKPLECCFSSMLRVIVLLEGEPPSQSQISGRLNRFPSRISLYLATSIIPSILTSFPIPADGKTSPQHDPATTRLHCGDGGLGVMRGVGFAPDIAFSLMAKKLNICLI